ncbi:MAG: LON peptidase substrate-binding domain-containing protein [Pseudomonadota bacterium]
MRMRAGSPVSLADLPRILPVFPLSAALLLPHGRLPLNIFEPRYLAMIDDALAAPGRLIGMIQPIAKEAPERPPRLYATGCAGRITSFNEADDGRYQITLAGVCRFNVVGELALHRGYRRVVPDFSLWQVDLTPPAAASQASGIDRERLLRSLKAYFTVNNITADWQAIKQTPDERLVITLAMVCPFEPQEKQALLESATLVERSRVMIALIEMSALKRGAGESVKH